MRTDRAPTAQPFNGRAVRRACCLLLALLPAAVCLLPSVVNADCSGSADYGRSARRTLRGSGGIHIHRESEFHIDRGAPAAQTAPNSSLDLDYHYERGPGFAERLAGRMAGFHARRLAATADFQANAAATRRASEFHFHRERTFSSGSECQEDMPLTPAPAARYEQAAPSGSFTVRGTFEGSGTLTGAAGGAPAGAPAAQAPNPAPSGTLDGGQPAAGAAQ